MLVKHGPHVPWLRARERAKRSLEIVPFVIVRDLPTALLFTCSSLFSLTLTPNLTLTLTLTQVESVERLHAAATQKATAAAEALAQQVAVQARTLLDVTKVTRHQHLKQITEGAGIGL